MGSPKPVGTQRATRPKKSHRLGPLAAALARSFKVTPKGSLVMPKADFRTWRKSGLALQGSARRAHAADLIALALRFRREAGDAAIEAVAQLYVLASDLLRSEDTLPPKPAAPRR